MDAPRFDALTKAVTRPPSRRAAVRGLGAGGAAALGPAGGAMVGTRHDPAAHARPAGGGDATPSGEGDEEAEFLFVQTSRAGTWAPNPEEDGVYTLTLTGATAQTIYFSDRPERIVGVVPTPQFLDGLGFTPANPPNAALVARTAAGEDALVVELLAPRFDEAAGTLTYDARVLADYPDGLAHLASRQADPSLPASFGPAGLFIDSCADQVIECLRDGDLASVGDLGSHNFCWSFGDFCCRPCEGGDHRYWESVCEQTFAACQGDCLVTGSGQCW